MSSVMISILAMYFFILLGFSAKRVFSQDIHAKTLNLLSVYFLQPFLTFWGLMQRPIDMNLIMAPLWYLVIVLTIIIVVGMGAKVLFSQTKERSIATVAAIIGNTGNLGIPLGIALFGIESVPFMTLINLMNVFIVYTIGVFFYSRGNFSVKASLVNIIKLPILWFALLAFLFNVNEVSIHASIMQMLHMGAYASMVIQLLLFGIYLAESKMHHVDKKLLSWVMSVKFIVLPLVAVVMLGFISIDPLIKGMIFMELFMPLAVANINLASLYDCHPNTVTVLVFTSSLLFLGLMFVYIPIVNALFL